MRVVISSVLLKQITDHAARSRDEVCGLLLGRPGTIEAVVPTANVAADRARSFEIDPAALLAAHRGARRGGAAIVGCYHSHPGGDATPSLRDATDAAADGAIWLIVAGPAVRGWRAVASGAVRERFDPVELVALAPPTRLGQKGVALPRGCP